MTEIQYKIRVDPLRKDFEATVLPYLIILATAIIWVSALKDVVHVGVKPLWIALRFGYLPYMIGVHSLTKRLVFGRHYEMPLLGAGLYITLFVAYFSLSTGFFASTYVNGLVQLYTVMAVMPLRRVTFLGLMAASIFGFSGVVLFFGGSAAVPASETISNLVPLIVCPPIVFGITSRLRRQKYCVETQLENTLEEREKVIVEQSTVIAKSETRSALVKQAEQLSHDIRSPLQAINIVANLITNVSEEHRDILLSGVKRINCVAESLLASKRNVALEVTTEPTASAIGGVAVEVTDAPQLKRVSVPDLVNQIVLEKKIAVPEDRKIEWIVEHSIGREVVPDHIETGQLERIISNLVGNSIDAISQCGSVFVNTQTELDCLVIQIKDTGKGIPREIIGRVTDPGFTFGKSNGNGLGLSHAKHWVNKWGGKIHLESSECQGTLVTLHVPLHLDSKPSSVN